MVDVDEVAGCPLGLACESCQSVDDLALATFETPVGVYCATICGACLAAGRFATVSYPTAVGRVMMHCDHLGIDADDMAAALAGEAGRAE